MHRTAVLVIAGAAVAATVVAGCSSSKKSADKSSSAAPSSSASSTAPAITGTINVAAASSLTEAFTTLGTQFEAANPGTKVVFNFGASSTLATQINGGAPEDVFASASPTNMTQVVTAGGATGSVNFVKNVMEIAVPPSNPANVTGVADLAKSSVKVALCEATVPCGSVAAKVFANAKVTVKPVTLEPDVKSTLTVVESGDVDAGVVYVTDVRSAGTKVKGITIPDDVNASTEYPIAALTKAANATGGQAFVAYVLSDAGQAVLAADGFQKP